MLSPLVVEGETYLCRNRDLWPPAHARFPDSEVRAKDPAKYEQIKVWRRVCGLKHMEADKCLTCPLVLRETRTGPVVVNEGVPSAPVPAVTLSRKGRGR